MLRYFWKNRNKCRHKKITPFSLGNYCPDCGKKILISWLVIRCECCQTKRQACVIFNSPVPRDKYCMKCGSAEFYIEKKETLEVFDFHYAVISKAEEDNTSGIREILQIWVENSHDKTSGFRLIPLLAD